MSKLVLGLVGALVLVGAIVAFTVLRTPQEASAPLEPIPLATSAAATEPATVSATEVAPTAIPIAAATEAAPAATTAPVATEAAPTAAPAEASTQTLQIVQEESEVRFIIDEVLNNAPFTVVGVTNQVAGEIAVNPADPSQSQVGIIQVNARTLATDNDFRNRAIKNSILSTDQYELITFEPTGISGLPASGTVGESYNFQMTGNLTVRDVTREVIFDVTLTPVSETRLEGLASSTIRYADFGISIPRVPSVASVADEVRLELDFVAAAG